MGDSVLPRHLRGKRHNDWIFPFSLIPRGWTSFRLSQPPKLIWGYKVYDWIEYKYLDGKRRAAPDPCQRTAWAFAFTMPFHISFTIGKTGWYLRLGARYDTNDEYYTVPSFKLGKIEGELFAHESKRVTYKGVSRWV